MQNNWRPIAEAPRDGNPFLVYCPNAKKHKIIEGWYNKGEYKTQYETRIFYTLMNSTGKSIEATHFMPLPSPPVKGE